MIDAVCDEPIVEFNGEEADKVIDDVVVPNEWVVIDTKPLNKKVKPGELNLSKRKLVSLYKKRIKNGALKHAKKIGACVAIVIPTITDKISGEIKYYGDYRNLKSYSN